MPRNTQSSLEIIRRHARIYRDVFADCEIVASAPGVFFWSGDHVAVDGALCVCQQIPLRVYVGLRTRWTTESNSPPLCFATDVDSHLVYDCGSDTFKPLQIRATEEANTIASSFDAVSGDLIRSLPRRLEGTYEIVTLHELKPGAGANWSGAFSGALAAAILGVTGVLSEQDVQSWRDQPTAELCRPGELFDVTHRLGWIVESALHGGAASGYGTFTSLLPGDQPTLYAADPRGPGEPTPFSIWPNDNALLNHGYGGARLSECQSRARCRSLPAGLHCGLIYTGRPKQTAASVVHARTQLRSIESSVHTSEIFKRVGAFKGLKTDPVTLLLSRSNRTGTVGATPLAGLITDALAVSSLRVFSALSALWDADELGGRDEKMVELARSVRAVSGGLYTLGLDWLEATVISAQIFRKAWAHGFFDQVATKPTGGARGGQLVYLAPFDQQFALELVELCTQVGSQLGLPVTLDWSSELDGVESDGLRIEHHSGRKRGISRIGTIPDRRRHVALVSGGVDTYSVASLRPDEVNRLQSEATVFITSRELDRIWIFGSELRLRGTFGGFMFGRAALYPRGASYLESLLVFALSREGRVPARFLPDRFRADLVKPVNDLLLAEAAGIRWVVRSVPPKPQIQDRLLWHGFDVRDLPADFLLILQRDTASTKYLVAVDSPDGFDMDSTDLTA